MVCVDRSGGGIIKDIDIFNCFKILRFIFHFHFILILSEKKL